jgi:hypothetical protein
MGKEQPALAENTLNINRRSYKRMLVTAVSFDVII